MIVHIVVIWKDFNRTSKKLVVKSDTAKEISKNYYVTDVTCQMYYIIVDMLLLLGDIPF